MIKRFSASSIRNGQKTTKLWDQVSNAGDFDSIATQTVSTAVASVTFSSIPQNYTHLQIRFAIPSPGTDIRFQFNSDTAANYTFHYLYGEGASCLSGNAATTSDGYAGFYYNNSNVTGGAILDFVDYANTNKFKTVKGLTGQDNNGSGIIMLVSSHWRSTAAINSIKLYHVTGNIGAGASFALYGLK